MFDWLKPRSRPPIDSGADLKSNGTILAWHGLGQPSWPLRDSAAFAREGYGARPTAWVHQRPRALALCCWTRGLRGWS